MKQLVIVERTHKTLKTDFGHVGRGNRREFVADVLYTDKEEKRIINSCCVRLAGKAERYPDKFLDTLARAYFRGVISGKVNREDKSYELVGINDIY